ncbi:MAG TPA: BTAD domain-containing putative transcriptional regulator [Actinophytocola sp.]|uniref:AfsR/SARP family transcriptional regulator n=1 Tax=Actinophytocola sp. TaxID=1872138 RepID=UPI002DB7C4DA|nr:BTAD domain-containing putative transcriptional regulator [Actinophytocola sp.]HEU5470887.1 BTAD domain-containing putative transcriptional regulator [Actinophytocola sp.]
MLRLLGPLELAVGRQPLNIGGPRQRIVLATLALNANLVTSVHELVEALWDDSPPETARAQIQTCISSLRKLFGEHAHPGAIRTRAPGYLLEIAPTDLDSEEFTRLVAGSRGQAEQGRYADAATMLRQALELWRGPPLADIDSAAVQRGASRFEDSRLAAIEERVRLDLTLGRHEEIIGELAALVGRYPLRERLAGYRMLALYRSGRQADALEVGRLTRHRLVEELGIEPGHELQRLESAILNRDQALELERVAAPAAASQGEPAGAPPVLPDRPVIPRQLPASIADFTGRTAQIDEIKQVLLGEQPRYAVRIVGINGSGGVGKSSLAVRAAHEVSDAFPDGLLYGEIQNSDGADATAKLLVRFLRALGVTGQAMPNDLQERIELYRSLLADKRLLVVLDDATGEEQVQALLPGSPTCAVIATSRMRLSGLWGAHWIDVDVLDTEQSMELLARIVGDKRIRAEQSAAVDLVGLCGGLPLALRIAGARLASRPHWAIGALVRRLSDEASRLDEFSHRGLELRCNIDLTYRSLRAPVARLFRLLALVRAPDVPEWTAAALLGTSLDDAADVLESLVDARLLDLVEYSGERVRYRMHSLIRVYALERLMQTESRADREEAMGRVLGGWLALAETAHRREYGGDFTILHGTAPRWAPPGGWQTTVPDEPMGWWKTERGSLVAAVRQAAGAGLDEMCWDLALTSVTLFEAGGFFDDWRETSQLGLEVSRTAGNRLGQAAMLYSLGTLNMFQKRLAEAERFFASALDIFESGGNAHGRALVLRNIGIVAGLVGNFPVMLKNYLESIELMRTVGDRMGEAHILRDMASYWLDEGDHDTARGLLDDALAICRQVKCLRGEAQVLNRFAHLHLGTGEVELAGQEFERVGVIVRQLGDRIGEAYAWYGLGLARQAEGCLESAEPAVLEALSCAKRVGERMIEGKALYALGDIALLRGNGPTGARYLGDAGRVFERLGATLWFAKALVLQSEVHAADDPRLAAAQATRARELLAGLDSAEAARWLTRLDATPTTFAEFHELPG